MLQEVLHLPLDHIKGDIIHAAVDDDIRKVLRRLDIKIMHGFDRRQILFNDVFQVPSPFIDIPKDPAQNALIRVGLHEDFDIKEIPQPFIL